MILPKRHAHSLAELAKSLLNKLRTLLDQHTDHQLSLFASIITNSPTASPLQFHDLINVICGMKLVRYDLVREESLVCGGSIVLDFISGRVELHGADFENTLTFARIRAKHLFDIMYKVQDAVEVVGSECEDGLKSLGLALVDQTANLSKQSDLAEVSIDEIPFKSFRPSSGYTAMLKSDTNSVDIYTASPKMVKQLLVESAFLGTPAIAIATIADKTQTMTEQSEFAVVTTVNLLLTPLKQSTPALIQFNFSPSTASSMQASPVFAFTANKRKPAPIKDNAASNTIEQVHAAVNESTRDANTADVPSSIAADQADSIANSKESDHIEAGSLKKNSKDAVDASTLASLFANCTVSSQTQKQAQTPSSPSKTPLSLSPLSSTLPTNSIGMTLDILELHHKQLDYRNAENIRKCDIAMLELALKREELSLRREEAILKREEVAMMKRTGELELIKSLVVAGCCKEDVDMYLNASRG